jgi:plastocyanin
VECTAGPGTVAVVLSSRTVRLLAGGCVAGCAVVLAGCQDQAAVNREPHLGNSTASASGGVQQVRITTDQHYRFNPSTITVHPGRVRITLAHVGTGAPHDWSLVDFPADNVPLVTPGQSQSVEFTAPAPGTYAFICTIHIAQGQTGTLVVLPS